MIGALVIAGTLVSGAGAAAGRGRAVAGGGSGGSGGSGGITAMWQPVGPNVDGRAAGFPDGLAGRVTAVTAVPGLPPTEIVGTLGGLWMAPSTGAWTDVTKPSWPSTSFGALADDPVHPSVVYAGMGYDEIDDESPQAGAGVLKSTDGGHTWTSLATRVPLMRGCGILQIAVERQADQTVYIAANNGVFRSTDGGASWQQVLALTDSPAEVRLAVDAANGSDLLVGVAGSPVKLPNGHTT